MTGMSAGGRTIGELVTSAGGAGVPHKCAAILVAELNDKPAWGWPAKLPITMYHMPKDGVTEKLVRKTTGILKKRKVPFVDKQIVAEPIDEKFLMSGGHGLNATTSQKVLAAFKKANLLNDKGNLRMDPYNPKPKTRWMK